MTVTELFERLPSRLREDAASGVDATLQWNLTDAEDPGAWAVAIKEGSCTLIPGGVAEPDTTFTTTSQDLA